MTLIAVAIPLPIATLSGTAFIVAKHILTHLERIDDMNLDVIIELEKAADATKTLYKKNVTIGHVPSMDYRPVIFVAGTPLYGANENVYNKLNDNTVVWVSNFVVGASQEATISTYLLANGWSVVSTWYE